MRAPLVAAAAVVLAVAALAGQAFAQAGRQGAPAAPADAVRPGMIVRSDVDRTLGKVERIDAGPDGRKVLVVISYDQPPLRRAVPAERVAEVRDGVARVDFGRRDFDSLPSAR